MQHWTERSIDNYLYRIVSDATVKFGPLGHEPVEEEIEDKLGEKGITLEELVKIVRREGLKVALVVYDDQDPTNKRGPIISDIFRICWERQGKPRDFFELGGDLDKRFYEVSSEDK
jgi:hypothetical protein